jgi:hypothetical protein
MEGQMISSEESWGRVCYDGVDRWGRALKESSSFAHFARAASPANRGNSLARFTRFISTSIDLPGPVVILSGRV